MNNVFRMVVVKLMNDNSIQNDNIMRDELQKRVRSFEKTSANGESIQILRKKCTKISFSKIKEKAHLSPERKRGGALTLFRDNKEN